MTDRELKKFIKKLGIACIISFVAIIILSVYTLGSTKAKLSIYENNEYSDNLELLGINEEEFKQYLAVFGNLLLEDNDENIKNLDLVTEFIDCMYPTYEGEVSEKTYDSAIVTEVAKEIRGTVIDKKVGFGESYTYNQENNVYTKHKKTDRILHCIHIEEISKKDEKIEVIYKLAEMTSKQMSEYLVGKETDFEEYKVKATVMINSEYQYSKYFVSNIEDMK